VVTRFGRLISFIERHKPIPGLTVAVVPRRFNWAGINAILLLAVSEVSSDAKHKL